MTEVVPTSASESSEPCLRCQRLLRDLPAGASFCPTCGLALKSVVPIDLSQYPLRTHLEHLHAALSERLNAAAPTQSFEQMHSLTLLGYANAMLHLGRRFENGLGFARNPEEAERCYIKSARLGNIYARAKLGDDAPYISMEDPIPAEVVPESP